MRPVDEPSSLPEEAEGPSEVVDDDEAGVAEADAGLVVCEDELWARLRAMH